MGGQSSKMHRSRLMNDAQSETLHNTTSLINFVIDLLLAILIGFLTSVLMVIFTILIAGPKFSMAEITREASQILIPTEYEGTTSSEAFLVPISSSVLSVLIARNLIRSSTTRKNWIIVTIVVCIVASLAGILSTMQFIGPTGLLWIIVPYLISVAPPISIFFFFVVLPIGLSLGIIFVSKKHIVKILMAAVTAALFGSLFELVVLGLALYEAF